MRLAEATRAEYEARMRRFAEWKRALFEGTEAERMTVGWEGFPELAVLSCEPLRRALEDPNKEVRLAAVAALRRMGTRDVVPIVNGGLQNPCAETRYAAADALAEVGDERSVEPLRRRLDECTHGSSGRQIWFTLLLYGIPLFQIGVLFSGLLVKPLHWVIFFGPCLTALLEFWTRWRQVEPLRRYTRALTGIWERHPEADLGQAEASLRTASRNVLLQAPEARAVCRETVAAIEKVRSLPVAAEGGAGDGSRLPRPAEPLPSRPERLPRV